MNRDTVILAKWTDNTNTQMGMEIFSGDTDPLDILEACADGKRIYNIHIATAQSEEFLLFTDGTRVTLEMMEVQELESVKRYKQLK